MNGKKYLKISELADLARINKRTLQYYDNIGLFSPKKKEENGYRYYTLEQLYDLGIILSLKELDMPLKDIQKVLSGGIKETTHSLEHKIKETDKRMRELADMKQILSRKLEAIKVTNDSLLQVKILELKQEYILCSTSIENKDFNGVIEEGYELLRNEAEYLFANNEYGLMINHKKKEKDIYNDNYDYVFLTISKKKKDTVIKPKGKYLSVSFKGDEDAYEGYKRILDYRKEHNYVLEGYFYEKAIYETVLENQEEAITEIQVKIKDKNLREQIILGNMCLLFSGRISAKREVHVFLFMHQYFLFVNNF